MKNSAVGSIVNITRKNILLLGLVLGLVGFGLVAFKAAAQRADDKPVVTDDKPGMPEAPMTGVTVTGGGTSNWDVQDYRITSNGLPSGGTCTSGADGSGASINDANIPGQGDAFDLGGMIWVNNVQVGGALTQTGSTVNFAPVSISGLNANMQYYAASGSATMRILVTLQNPTGGTIAVPVDYATNFGSDGGTVIQSSSNGNTTFELADRWLVTDDSPTVGDPANTTVLFGPGSPAVTPASVSSTVFNCAGPEGARATYNMSIPAGQTQSLMFFQKMNSTSALATSEAPTFFDTNPTAGGDLLSGLSSTQLSQIVNWSYGCSPISNPSFETSNFTGWLTAGNSSVIGPVAEATPTNGSFQARMTSESGSVSAATLNTFLGTTLPPNERGGVTEGSAIKQTFSLAAGQPLTFDWKYASSESASSGYDYSFVVINGAVTELADSFSTPYPTNYNTFTFVAPSSGNYVVGVGVVDTGDTVVDSRLFVDNFSACPPVPVPTTTTVTSSAIPSVFGQNVTFTATVAPNPGAGATVNFVVDGGAPIATTTNASGVATTSTSSLTTGHHTVTANFAGSTGFGPSSGSLTGGQTVNKANTTTALASSVNPSVWGQSVTFTATISVTAPGAGTPTGTVSFRNNGVNIATCAAQPVAANVATCSISTLSVGSHPITAAYNGDGNFNSSPLSNTVAQVVNKADTTTTVTASPVSPGVFGQSVTFTATVAVVPSGAGTPTGTVTFNIDGNLYCVNTPLTGLTATCTQAGLPALPAGVRNVVAIYNGDANFNGSSGTLNYTVNKANTATTITSDNPDPSLVNQPYTVTWTVVPDPVQVNSGNPTGTVTVNGGTGGGSCTAAVAAGSCQLTPTTIGVKTLTAVYSGDNNFNTSTGISAPPTGGHTVNVQIAGTVRNGITNAPIAGETMVLGCASPVSIPSTTTNAAGQYSFAGQFVGPCFVFPLSIFSEPYIRNYATVLANITNADFLIWANAAEFPRKMTHVTQYVTPGAAGTMPVILNSQDNEATLGYSITYDINPFAQPPTFVCGANAPGCTITNNTSVLGRVGVTITPAGGVFTRPDGTPLEGPEAAGPKEIARINFQTAVTTTLPSTDFVIGSTPTPNRALDAAGHELLMVFNTPIRIVFAQGREGDVAGRNAGSGTFESADVVQTRLFVAGVNIPVLTHNEYQRADTAPAATKGNGVLNATDLIQTRRYVAGLDAPQTAGGPGAANPPPARGEGERAAAAAAAESEITVGDAQATNSTSISVPIRMKASGNEVATSFTVRYDETRLGNPSVTLGDGTPEDAVLTVGKSEPGYIRILIDSTRAFAATKDGHLVDITFAVLETAPSGAARIEIDDLVFSDAEANATRSGATNGKVTIAGPIPADDTTETTLTRVRKPTVEMIEEWLEPNISILRPREPGETQRTITRTRVLR